MNTFHCPLSAAFLFHLSPKLCPSTAGCIVPSMPNIVLCLLLFCFTFHQGFVHPLQDVSLYQYLSLPSVCCFSVSPFTKALSTHCRMYRSINTFHCPLSVAFLFHLSPRLCPSTAGCIVLSIPFIVLCLLPSCFTFHQGFVHPLQDVSLHQYLSLPSVCCFSVPAVPSFLAMSLCHLLPGHPFDLFALLGCHSEQRSGIMVSQWKQNRTKQNKKQANKQTNKNRCQDW